MIQFNLLPDVKIEFIRTQRIKKLVISASIIVSIAVVSIVSIIAIDVYVRQRGHISRVEADIALGEERIKDIDDIDRVLTVQNQLNTITGLHDDKPVVSRLFPYIETVTPAEIAITELSLDFEESSMVITGEADTLEDINVYVDTLKFTEFFAIKEPEEGEDNEENNVEPEYFFAFPSVELSDFTRDDDGASFVITVVFDEQIFDSLNDIELVVTSRITTRSEIDSPGALFVEPTEEE